jgi:hypothetical protein
MQSLIPEQETANDMSALEDSVWVIDQMLALESSTEESLESITRNVEHIEIMLTKEHILESGADLEPFREAILRARG